MKFLIFIAVIFIIYAVIENRLMLFTRTEYFCTNQSKIKIVHLSDLHRRSFGKNNCRLIRKIKFLEPDIIIFSGDLITRDCKSFYNTEKLVQAISKIAPVYFSFGNHELDMKRIYPEKYRKFISLLKENNIHILDNCIESVTVKNRTINIAGASLKYSVYKKDNSYRNLDEYSADEPWRAAGRRTAGRDAHRPAARTAHVSRADGRVGRAQRRPAVWPADRAGTDPGVCIRGRLSCAGAWRGSLCVCK